MRKTFSSLLTASLLILALPAGGRELTGDEAHYLDSQIDGFLGAYETGEWSLVLDYLPPFLLERLLAPEEGAPNPRTRYQQRLEEETELAARLEPLQLSNGRVENTGAIEIHETLMDVPDLAAIPRIPPPDFVPPLITQGFGFAILPVRFDAVVNEEIQPVTAELLALHDTESWSLMLLENLAWSRILVDEYPFLRPYLPDIPENAEIPLTFPLSGQVDPPAFSPVTSAPK